MARRPDRTRFRDRGNELAPLDGFAAGPVERARPNAVQENPGNEMVDHMQAILRSDLRDDITDEEAFARAIEDRATDNFGAALDMYKQRLAAEDGQGLVINAHVVNQIEGPRRQAEPAPRQNLPAFRGNQNAVGHPHQPQGAHCEEWLQLRRLPPYIFTQIRALGRNIWANYAGHMQLEDINTICHIPQLPQFHSREFVRNHVEWIRQHGNEVLNDNIDFGDNIRGYGARVSLWQVAAFEFLIVQDNHGEYVYGWPRAPRPALAQAPNVPRLR
jgi:hypothetical protein